MQRTHFTAGYTLYNCVCDKLYIYIFFNRYPIMVKCLNIGRSLAVTGVVTTVSSAVVYCHRR